MTASTLIKRSFDSIFKPLPFVVESHANLFEIQKGFAGSPDDPNRKWVVPDYQRNHTWTVYQASAFVGSMITGGFCPPCWINRNIYDDHMEIIDGQHRLFSLYHWMLGNIPAIEPTTGENIYVHEFDDKDIRQLYRKTEVKIMYVDLSPADRLMLYLRINATGTPHTLEEIQRVRNLLAEYQS
jgi:uncharacterized protein with ParB-like and HNH nuclease domain